MSNPSTSPRINARCFPRFLCPLSTTLVPLWYSPRLYQHNHRLGRWHPEGPAQRVLWMDGPAGVGKSAVAQSCAEILVKKGCLAASVFFSRPNRRQDHKRLFPSLSYQIATKCEPFAEIVDLRIRKDPTLITKAIHEQFQELLVRPLQQLQKLEVQKMTDELQDGIRRRARELEELRDELDRKQRALNKANQSSEHKGSSTRKGGNLKLSSIQFLEDLQSDGQKRLEQLQDDELGQLRAAGKDYAEGRVIIVDGLDECDDVEAQTAFVDIITASVQNQTTSLRWIFTSRPERHIVTTFAKDNVCSLTFHVNLPVSRKTDHEILLFLAHEMTKIRQHFGLPSSWPSEVEYAGLVDLSDGLFIYSATATRFIGDRNSLAGPVNRLQTVLALASKSIGKASAERPLAALDVFYSLILQNVPSAIIPSLQKILLLHESSGNALDHGVGKAIRISNILKLSEVQFRNSCAYLHSVLHVTPEHELKFYHASFMDFMQDPMRSEKFSVYAAIGDLRAELLEYLGRLNAPGAGGNVSVELTWPFISSYKIELLLYRNLIQALFFVCQSGPTLEPKIVKALSEFSFSRVALQWGIWSTGLIVYPKEIRQRVPIEFNDKIIRAPSGIYEQFRLRKSVAKGDVYILGSGENRALLLQPHKNPIFQQSWVLCPYPTLQQSL
ncbi:hypothetical protein D9756_004324 [Leucocoprinus leucothites]|uniref:Nephrocystin 3-like N-terminal domain-containing protein n=1 Tax=Leucocoprinus leucothites TaxID=201217 RepID=A0A8H5G0R7_9AGAR|nr:hypothetical protein D9756_004324 [Leucoagaricus leucothites]